MDPIVNRESTPWTPLTHVMTGTYPYSHMYIYDTHIHTHTTIVKLYFKRIKSIMSGL